MKLNREKIREGIESGLKKQQNHSERYESSHLARGSERTAEAFSRAYKRDVLASGGSNEQRDE